MHRQMTGGADSEVASRTTTVVLWFFAFLAVLVAIPALIIAVLSYTAMPSESCPSLSATAAPAPPPPTSTPAPVGTVVSVSEGSNWTYSGSTGPEHWHKISPDFAMCGAGRRQSPINIKSAASTTDTSISLSFSMFSDLSAVLNNGFKDLVSSTHKGYAVSVSDIGGYLTYQNNDYKLLELVFRTPSEHRVDDEYKAGEIHLVHQSAAGRFLVVAFLIDEASASPTWWGTQLLEKFPKDTGASPVNAIKLPYSSLLQGMLGGTSASPCWTYSGSFTTPPCSEDVTWIVNKAAIRMSSIDIKALRDATGVNNRPVQPLNGRTVKSSN